METFQYVREDGVYVRAGVINGQHPLPSPVSSGSQNSDLLGLLAALTSLCRVKLMVRD